MFTPFVNETGAHAGVSLERVFPAIFGVEFNDAGYLWTTSKGTLSAQFHECYFSFMGPNLSLGCHMSLIIRVSPTSLHRRDHTESALPKYL